MNSRTTVATRKRLLIEIDQLFHRSVEELRSAGFANERVEEICTCLNQVVKSFRMMEGRAWQVSHRFGMSPQELMEICDFGDVDDERIREVAELLGCDAHAILVATRELAEIEKLSSRLEKQIKMSRQSVYDAEAVSYTHLTLPTKA